MTVDLSTKPPFPDDWQTGGIVTYRNGVEFFSLIVGSDEDGDCSVRTWSGEYSYYTPDGWRCHLRPGRSAVPDSNGYRAARDPDEGESEWDVVAFERCSYETAKAKGKAILFNDACRRANL